MWVIYQSGRQIFADKLLVNVENFLNSNRINAHTVNIIFE